MIRLGTKGVTPRSNGDCSKEQWTLLPEAMPTIPRSEGHNTKE